MFGRRKENTVKGKVSKKKENVKKEERRVQRKRRFGRKERAENELCRRKENLKKVNVWKDDKGEYKLRDGLVEERRA